MNEMEHELIARRYWREYDETTDITTIHNTLTAIPLCNVLDWEESSWEEEVPEPLTAVLFPYETKYVNIPFQEFHTKMKQYRKNARSNTIRAKFN